MFHLTVKTDVDKACFSVQGVWRSGWTNTVFVVGLGFHGNDTLVFTSPPMASTSLLMIGFKKGLFELDVASS